MHRAQSAGRRIRIAIAAASIGAIAALVPPIAAQQPPRGAVERIRSTGHLRLGYRVDARPFSYRNESGHADGYSIALCQQVADGLKSDLQLPALAVDWVPVSLDERFRAVQQGQIDLLCGADTVTLARRQEVAFSIPIYPGGIGAVTRADVSYRLREVLTGQVPSFRPNWRASAGAVLQSKAFTAVAGTTAERWLTQRITDLEVIAKVASVPSYDAGIQAVLDRTSDVFFGERAILVDTTLRHKSRSDLAVIGRLFTYEPMAFALARGDDDFHLRVDRALSRLYRSDALTQLYSKAFGDPDQSVLTFFRWNALTD